MSACRVRNKNRNAVCLEAKTVIDPVELDIIARIENEIASGGDRACAIHLEILELEIVVENLRTHQVEDVLQRE
ncbi:hypothetical protein D3C80_823970 [compost metagenome]